MKKLVVLLLVLFAFTSVFAQEKAEVSKKKDVAIFGVYANYEIPDNALAFFDNKLVGVFNGLKRFNVVGYQYRLDESSVTKFMEKIKKLKTEKIMNDKDLVDEDFGEVVIPAMDLYQMVNSFFTIIPQITGYVTDVETTVVKDKKGNIVYERDIKGRLKRDERGNLIAKIKKTYSAKVNVSIKILKSDGSLLDVYTDSQSSKSPNSINEAYEKAVGSAMSGLNLFLRKMDEFKLKSKVLKVEGGTVYMELGKDLGVKPGYEFVIRKTETLGGDFKRKVDKGLVRVSGFGDNWSTATTIFGNPQVGDQLVEAAMAGSRINFYAGIAPMNVANFSTLTFKYIDESPSPDPFTSTVTGFKPSTFVPEVGLTYTIEAGYNTLIYGAVGAMIGAPLSAYMDLGAGYELYLGPVSITAQLPLSFLGNYVSLGKIVNNTGYIQVNSTQFPTYHDVNVSLVGTSIGTRPKIGFNLQVSQKFKIRAYAGFALFFLDYYKVQFKDASPADPENVISDSEDLSAANVTFLLDGTAASGLPVNYTGPFAGLEFIFRF